MQRRRNLFQNEFIWQVYRIRQHWPLHCFSYCDALLISYVGILRLSMPVDFCLWSRSYVIVGVVLKKMTWMIFHEILWRGRPYDKKWLDSVGNLDVDPGIFLVAVYFINFISMNLFNMYTYRLVQKSKLLILSEYFNKTEKIGETWTNTNSYRENEALSDIFTWNILLTIVVCLNILWLKVANEITADYTARQLHEHDVIKLCSIEYLTIEIGLVLPTFKSWTAHTTVEFLTLGLLSSYWNIYHSTTAYFFEPPSMWEGKWHCQELQSIDCVMQSSKDNDVNLSLKLCSDL